MKNFGISVFGFVRPGLFNSSVCLPFRIQSFGSSVCHPLSLRIQSSGSLGNWPKMMKYIDSRSFSQMSSDHFTDSALVKSLTGARLPRQIISKRGGLNYNPKQFQTVLNIGNQERRRYLSNNNNSDPEKKRIYIYRRLIFLTILFFLLAPIVVILYVKFIIGLFKFLD